MSAARMSLQELGSRLQSSAWDLLSCCCTLVANCVASAVSCMSGLLHLVSVVPFGNELLLAACSCSSDTLFLPAALLFWKPFDAFMPLGAVLTLLAEAGSVLCWGSALG